MSLCPLDSRFKLFLESFVCKNLHTPSVELLAIGISSYHLFMGIEDELHEHLQALTRNRTAKYTGHLLRAASNGGVRAIKVAIGLLTVASLLTGCSSPPPDKPYIEDIRANASLLSTYSDESLIELAHYVCETRRAGVSYGEIRNGLIKPDDTPEFEVQVAFVLARSISHYCPDQAP